MYSGKKVTAIITAGGRGTRMGVDTPKQFLDIGGETIIEKTIKVFRSCDLIDRIIVTMPKEEIKRGESLMDSLAAEEGEPLKGAAAGKNITIIPGGNERQDSVYNAIKYLVPGEEDIVLVHDGVRPYVDTNIIERVIAGAEISGACYCGIKSVDTLRHPELGTLDRELVYRVQTPQGFKGSVIKEAFAKAEEDGFYGTDDISLVERIGIKPKIVEGSERNIKITTPEDLAMIKIIEGTAENLGLRIGTGFDVHAFGEPGQAGAQKVRSLTLGGVKVPFEKGLIAHSDGDVLTHAVMDALLGAAAMPDIGRLFPDNDSEFDGISSIELLKRVNDKIAEAGYRAINIDATIMCQAPKLAPYIDEMRENIGAAIGEPTSCIGLKATTTEGLGFTGRGEGIAVNAIALIKSSNPMGD